jgi:hypothetical protein
MRMPDGIIVGALRPGTTKLYIYLRSHPHVYAAEGKILHFFDSNWSRKIDWNSGHFERALDHQFAAEATLLHLADAAAIERIDATVPNVRMEEILRNPVDWAHSHLNYRVAHGLDLGALEQAIEREISGDPEAFPFYDIGRYGGQVANVRSFPFNRPLSTLWYDDLVNKPKLLTNQPLNSSGLQSDGSTLYSKRVNSADRFRSRRLRRVSRPMPASFRNLIGRINRQEVQYPVLQSSTRQRMLEHLSPDILRLQAITGRDLRPWIDGYQNALNGV